MSVGAHEGPPHMYYVRPLCLGTANKRQQRCSYMKYCLPTRPHFVTVNLVYRNTNIPMRHIISVQTSALTVWQQQTTSHEPPYWRVCVPNSTIALINGTTHPWRHPVYVWASFLISCMDFPHAAEGVTTLLNTPFRLHLQFQTPLTQLLCNATAALSATPGTLTASCKKTTLPMRHFT